MIEPFPELSVRPTVVHVRTHAFSDRLAPFIRQTVLGLRPHVNNVVLALSTDCENPADVPVELIKRRDLQDPATCLAIAEYLRDRYPSIQLVMGHMGNGTRTGKLLAELLGVPLLGTFGGSDVNIELLKENYRDIYAELLRTPSAHFLTVAEYLRTKLLDQGAPAERLFVWHRGVNLADFELVPRAPDRARPVRLVVAARFYEVKGHEYLIRALALLKERGRRAELVLLGDGPLQDQMKALAGELGVERDVRFIGHVSHGEVTQHLRSSDVYIHPSVHCAEGRMEGIPNAIMEAQATGLPVVATHHGGIAEVVLDGETGFLVPERDPAELARRIGELIDDGALRTRMGLRGRAHIEQEFNLDVQSRRLAARIFHTIQAGELFDHRGWSKHRLRPAPRGATDRIPGARTPGSPILLDGAKLLQRLTTPNFRSSRKVVGPIIVGYKRALWTGIFRPYLRFLTREISSFVGKELTAQLGGVNTGGSVPGPRATAVGRAQPDDEPELLMSSALCPDCPHRPPGIAWPDLPCKLDVACAQALQREFAPQVRPPPAPPRTAATSTERWLTDADLPATGTLAHPSAAYDTIHLRGDLQAVDDVPALLRELRRLLRPGGTLRLEIAPLPLGRDGARLLGDVAIPFAQHFFAPATLEALTGAPLRPVRRFGVAELRRWCATAGLVVREETRPHPHEDPCEMHVQARFAPLLRRSGLTRELLARSFAATLEAASGWTPVDPAG